MSVPPSPVGLPWQDYWDFKHRSGGEVDTVALCWGMERHEGGIRKHWLHNAQNKIDKYRVLLPQICTQMWLLILILSQNIYQ